MTLSPTTLEGWSIRLGRSPRSMFGLRAKKVLIRNYDYEIFNNPDISYWLQEKLSRDYEPINKLTPHCEVSGEFL